ncbi:MAG: hypothetical protein ACRDWS_11620 [Acidimicrobiia bacterium]
MSFPESPAYLEASQASTALVLSIIGLVCCQILGIVAWIMANNELEAIKAGKRNPANEGTATAARIIGIVGTVVLGITIVVGLLALAGLMAVPFTEDIFPQ